MAQFPYNKYYYNCNKFYLEIEGIKYEIIEPIKFDSVEFTLKRNEFDGFASEFINNDIDLIFDCNLDNTLTQYPAANIIMDIYNLTGDIAAIPISVKNKGIDGVIIFDCGYEDELGEYFSIFRGKLNLSTLQILESSLKVVIEGLNFEEQIRNGWETVINLQDTTDQDGEPITPLPPEVVKLHSKVLREESTAIGGGRTITASYDDLGLLDFSVNGKLIEQTNEIIYSNEDRGYSETTDILAAESVQQGSLFLNDETEDYNIKILVTGNLTVNCTTVGNQSNPTITMNIIDNGGATNVISQSVTATGQTVISLDFEKEYTITTVQEIVKIEIETQRGGAVDDSQDIEVIKNFSFTARRDTTTPASEANTHFIHETFDKIIENITGESGRFYSEFFGKTDTTPTPYLADGCGSKLVTTIGHQIRGFTLEERPTFDSFKKLFEESLQRIYNLGLSYENDGTNDIVRIEPKSFFYQNNVIASFSEVFDFEYKPANKKYFNILEVGYKKFGDEKLNNLDEFNSKQSYTIGIKNSKDKKELISNHLASGYIIEFLRRDQSKLTTTDNENDEENFLIKVSVISDYTTPETITVFLDQIQSANLDLLEIVAGEEITINGSVSNDGIYTVDRVESGGLGVVIFFTVATTPEAAVAVNLSYSLFDGGGANKRYIAERNENAEILENVISPETVYNLQLSPKRILINHIDDFKSILKYKDQLTHVIKFNKGEANYFLNSKLKAGLPCGYLGEITEGASVPISAIGTIYFSPEIATFKAIVSFKELLTIKEAYTGQGANKYGVIEFFDSASNKQKGYLLSLKYNPVSNICNFEVLVKQ